MKLMKNVITVIACDRWNFPSLHNMLLFSFAFWWKGILLFGIKTLFNIAEVTCSYRSGMDNSKSFVSKVLLRIKWKFE